MKQFVFSGIGFLFIALGLVGVIVPVLPTTPFVICAAGCFSASSPVLLRRLETDPHLGGYVRHYRYKTGIAKKAKIKALIFLWSSLTISAMVCSSPNIGLLLLVVGLAVSAHLLTIKTSARPKEKEPQQKGESSAGLNWIIPK